MDKLNSKIVEMAEMLHEKLDKGLAKEEAGQIMKEVARILGQFENEKLEQMKVSVKVLSDPDEFAKETQKSEEHLASNWAGTKDREVKTKVLMGDLIPGNCYQEIEEDFHDEFQGKQEEFRTDELADFSINQRQIAITVEEMEDFYKGNSLEENNLVVVIYLPEEREYDVISYKEMSVNKKLEEVKRQSEELESKIKKGQQLLDEYEQKEQEEQE